LFELVVLCVDEEVVLLRTGRFKWEKRRYVIGSHAGKAVSFPARKAAR